MYVKADMDKFAKEMRPFAQHTKRKGQSELSTTVDWQHISDLPAILKLDLKVYQENKGKDQNYLSVLMRSKPMSVKEGGYTLLAESVVVDPDYPEQLNHILREVLNYWCEQYPDRYIEKIYADAATEHGDMLARKLYFSPLYHVSDRAYVLDLRKLVSSL